MRERERERERRAYDHRQRLATTSLRKNNIDTQLAYDSTHMSNMSTIYDAGPRSPCAPSTQCHLRVRVYADDSAADQRDAGVSVAALGAGALGATATATHTATATALGATATATALGAGALGATATALGAGALGATATATATHTATATATALGAGALGAVPWPPLRRLPSHPPILLILLSWKWLISCCFVFSPCNEASVTPKL